MTIFFTYPVEPLLEADFALLLAEELLVLVGAVEPLPVTCPLGSWKLTDFPFEGVAEVSF